MTSLNKGSKILKNVLILLIIIIIPLITLGSFYFTNNEFRNTSNEILKKTPGFVGEYFSKYPTEREMEDKKTYLAKYYISIDSERAADKIYIVKKNNEVLYNDIIKRMNENDPSKTEEIIKLVRNIELRKNLLFSIYDEIENEKKTLFQNEVKRLEELDTYLAIREIKNSVTSDVNQINQIVKILSNMNEENASELLYYIDTDIKNRIITLMSLDKAKNIKSLINERELKERELINLARNYDVKDPIKAYEEIGNNELYSIDDLSIIYSNLSIKKSADILFYCKDEEFIEQLFLAIRKNERYNDSNNESKTVKIRKYINFLNEYENGINELVKVYEKMDPNDVANIVSKMMINNGNVSLFQVDENYKHEISDATIILDVIRRMKNSTVSEILNNLDSRKAAEISRRLAVP